MKFVFGSLYTMLMVALLTVNVAAEMPDVLGIQLGMPARDAHAKLQGALPKNKIQVISDTLPTIDKPVIKAFSSAPAEQIMIGMEGDQVTVTFWRAKDGSRLGHALTLTAPDGRVMDFPRIMGMPASTK